MNIAINRTGHSCTPRTWAAAGDNEGAVSETLTGILIEDEIAERRAAPNWPERVATAPTIAREARIEEGWDWLPDRFTGIAVPTLLITGFETTPELARSHR